MKFANKELEKRIAIQTQVVNVTKSNILKLQYAITDFDGIVREALLEKLVSEKYRILPVEEIKLSKLHTQNETAFSNRSNRRQDLISSMFSFERVIPA